MSSCSTCKGGPSTRCQTTTHLRRRCTCLPPHPAATPAAMTPPSPPPSRQGPPHRTSPDTHNSPHHHHSWLPAPPPQLVARPTTTTLTGCRGWYVRSMCHSPPLALPPLLLLLLLRPTLCAPPAGAPPPPAPGPLRGRAWSASHRIRPPGSCPACPQTRPRSPPPRGSACEQEGPDGGSAAGRRAEGTTLRFPFPSSTLPFQLIRPRSDAIRNLVHSTSQGVANADSASTAALPDFALQWYRIIQTG